ncbi:MAG TPA: ABC transporter ATP-binding protein [Clostridiaceae bacterium]|nr:ABC transporter ATP-binding protein [Clostridiaceae bacterium]
MREKPALEMKGITKRFGKTLANDDVSLSLYRGEIHALLGENGAGKSTLMNILLGVYKANSGEIFLDGERIVVRNPKDAANLRFGMVHQHFELIPTLSVAENISLSMDESDFFINEGKMNKQIREISEKFNLPVDARAKVWQLSVGEQQRVEIIKLLCRDCQVMILDEPSAVLTPQEAKEMFKTLRKMADEGKIVIFISHKMNEVMENADRITVLRGGRVEDAMLAKDATVARLTRAVVGARKEVLEPKRREAVRRGDMLLELTDVSIKNDKGLIALGDASFELYEGEIFAIAGVAGNGQRELAEALAGLRKVTSGTIRMNGEDITNTSAKKHIEAGISFIPEDRLKMGLVPEMNLEENAILKEFRKLPYSKHGLIKRKAVRSLTEKFVEDFDIKHGGTDLPTSMMSGGNQQKLLVAREINVKPKLIIAAYPVRGLDIGAAESISNILLDQRDQGVCVLFISEDLDEIFEVSDRVAVLCEGRIMGIKRTSETNFDEIGRLMSGEEV